MRALGGVAEVAKPIPSPKKDALIVRVTLKDGDDEADRVQPLLDTTAKVQQEYPGAADRGGRRRSRSTRP